MRKAKLKPENEEKLKRLRDKRSIMLGKRKKYNTKLPKFWEDWHSHKG